MQSVKKHINADILYATNNELGFDYLRDNMKFRLEDYVQRDLNYAIVDEVDSILIDEARTPLIISGASDESSEMYDDAESSVVRRFKKDEDYEVDEKARTVQLPKLAMIKLNSAFNITNLYAVENLQSLHHVNQALRAHAFFKRDVDYVVKDGEVLIVDEFTGRILPAAVIAMDCTKRLKQKKVWRLNKKPKHLHPLPCKIIFRLYKKFAGMTGTAATEAEEFYKIYNLDVISIPTNQTNDS